MRLLVNGMPAMGVAGAAVGASLDMVRKGTLQMYIEGIGYAHPFVPQLYYCSIPFVYRDRAHMLKFMKSDMVKKWQEELTKKSGLDILGEYGPFVRGPYRVLVSKRPILTLADLKGLKLRMYKNEMVMNLWKELGANITYIAWTEVYDGLKRGLIEAVTSPIALVESMHGAGSPQAQKVMILRQGNLAGKVALAKKLSGVERCEDKACLARFPSCPHFRHTALQEKE